MICKHLKSVICLLLLLLGQSCSNHQLLDAKKDRGKHHADNRTRKRTRPEEIESKPVGFSQWTPDLFKEKFGVDFNPRRMKDFKLEREHVAKDNLELIIKMFKKFINTRGGFIIKTEEKEAQFSHYANIIITSVVDEVLCGRVSNDKTRIFLSDQYIYGGTRARGAVDLVVCIEGSPNCRDNILLVTEVKTPSTLLDGLLQNCMELYEAYEQNPIKEEVYGVVTCGNQWIFTKYVGSNNEYSMKNWSQSRCFTIDMPNYIEDFDAETEASIEKIASYIKWIIKSSAEKFDNAIASKTSTKSPKKRRMGSA
ncbi:hypothetical protein [Cardinium endosymbiont of Culicoides punctatus]|uniref:hypothetical protein n=1 Tax=Cardinium endosymbiont of Culicoides punctatus TaxID=2304601 RepID=UPI0010590B44|nr:hypothetical protein [Cardinium endosymbiont of Culicoides punctatus]TDG95051.1 hypothetical protein CCPUN_06370 [Cardinium endosymbiont of Culicoides punctatus]